MPKFRFVWCGGVLWIKLKIIFFQFEFEAIASLADIGHVALDDIVYEPDQACSDTHHDNCDFQNGFCKWTNQPPEIGSWVVSYNEQDGQGPR